MFLNVRQKSLYFVQYLNIVIGSETVDTVTGNSVQLISSDKQPDVRCNVFKLGHQQVLPGGSLTFKAGDPERIEDAGSLLCLGTDIAL